MNKMVLNEKKTKAMFVASSRKLSELSSIAIPVNGSLIEPVTHERLLGIHLYQSVNWTFHVDILCNKISQRLGILQRIRHHSRLAYYNCLVLSLMDYCCVLWGNTSQQNLDRIHCLQKRVARLIRDTDYKHPFLPLFLKLGWLPIHERIKYFRCLTVYKANNNLTPSYLVYLIKLFCYFHRINTRGSQNQRLLLPKVNTISCKREPKIS